MKNILLAFAVLLSMTVTAAEPTLKDRIAAKTKIVKTDTWQGYPRTVFKFKGCTAWVVEPKCEPAAGSPWTWTMQWADFHPKMTGVTDLLARGWRHVTIDTYRHRMDAKGLEISRAFQKFLVDELGFAARVNLVGMSWGGFFSTRYAAEYPDCVARIYLDAPLLNFDGFSHLTKADAKGDAKRAAVLVGPWAKARPADGKWTTDPRMPVNMAGKIAAAKIPVLLLYGGKDDVCIPKLNCEMFMKAFKEAGGDIKVVPRPGQGHHPHGMPVGKTGVIVDFLK